MLAGEATSKHTEIMSRFGSTGSSHGIPPNLEGIMTQNVTIGNEFRAVDVPPMPAGTESQFNT